MHHYLLLHCVDGHQSTHTEASHATQLTKHPSHQGPTNATTQKRNFSVHTHCMICRCNGKSNKKPTRCTIQQIHQYNHRPRDTIWQNNTLALRFLATSCRLPLQCSAVIPQLQHEYNRIMHHLSIGIPVLLHALLHIHEVYHLESLHNLSITNNMME